MNDLRLAYLGTPAMAVPPLEALIAAGFTVSAVVTRQDARRGRGGHATPSAVKQAASAAGIAVHHRADELLGAGVDLGVVVAFGQLIRPNVLAEIPMINLHFSLLPRWRGAAPVERAILAGDAVTGVCLMEVTEGLDEGPVYARREVPIGRDTTAAELRRTLVAAGTELLVDGLSGGLGTPVPQAGEVTYASKITTADLHLDWSRPPAELHRVVRVGGAWTTIRGKRLKVLDADLVGADAGDVVHAERVGGLRPITVQPEGRGPMAWDDFLRGARLTPGERLGS